MYIPIEGSDKIVILCHGITFSLYGSVKYVNLFRQRGYSVLMYDHRHHGRSGGENATFGFYEKHDLKAWVDWAKHQCGQNGEIGLHGESYGAATALQYAAMDSGAAFVIADCAFSDLTELLTYHLKHDYGLPAFPFLQISSFITKLRAGFYYGDVSPIKGLPQVNTPIFFIHGANDDFTPTRMSVDLYKAKQGARKLFLAPNAGHAEAYWNNRQEYDRLVGEFLETVHSTNL
jgi:hypothetical protein